MRAYPAFLILAFAACGKVETGGGGDAGLPIDGAVAADSQAPDARRPDAAIPDAAIPDANPCTGSQSFAYTGGLQVFTAPCDAIVTFTVAGASGGNASGTQGGRGAIATGSFPITANTTATILVGGAGVDGTTQSDGGGTGGGGSFVVDTSGNPVVVAGGGGGAFYDDEESPAPVSTHAGGDGQATNDGMAGFGSIEAGGAGGTAGGGGGGGTWGGWSSGAGGGGFSGDGGAGSTVNGAGQAYINGGAGGTGATGRNGGYGGGGSAGFTGGGGGGYSGGGGGGVDYASSMAWSGGGGSYTADPNGTLTAGQNAGNGAVTITW